MSLDEGEERVKVHAVLTASSTAFCAVARALCPASNGCPSNAPGLRGVGGVVFACVDVAIVVMLLSAFSAAGDSLCSRFTGKETVLQGQGEQGERNGRTRDMGRIQSKWPPAATV